MKKEPSGAPGLGITRIMKRWSRDRFGVRPPVKAQLCAVELSDLEPVFPSQPPEHCSALLSSMKPSFITPPTLGHPFWAPPSQPCPLWVTALWANLSSPWTVYSLSQGLPRALLGPQHCPSSSQAMYSIPSDHSIY